MKTLTRSKRRRRLNSLEEPEQPAQTAHPLAELHSAVGNRVLARTLAHPGGERLLQRWFGLRFPGQAPPRSKYSTVLTIEGKFSGLDKKSFTVLSLSFGVSQMGVARATEKEEPEKGSERETKAHEARDFYVTKHVDDLSAALFKAATNGEPLDKVVVVMEKDGARNVTYTFSNVRIANIQGGSSGADGVPVEQITFSYESVSHKFEGR